MSGPLFGFATSRLTAGAPAEAAGQSAEPGAYEGSSYSASAMCWHPGAAGVGVTVAVLVAAAVCVRVAVHVIVRVYVHVGLAVDVLVYDGEGITGEFVAVGAGAGQFSANAFIAIVGLPVLSKAPLLYPCQPL